MHITSKISGKSFSETYGIKNGIVVDIGGRDVNGSLREFFQGIGMKYICIDMSKDPSVDIVVQPNDKIPLNDGSVDLVISTSCFEHDPCFWLTFREMNRIVKLGGYIYINAPSTGRYHKYPGDNWRFYSDAGQALAYWSGIQVSNEKLYPVEVVETFHIMGSEWNDFICVWKRVAHKQTNILVHDKIINTIGILEKKINSYNLKTRKKI